MESNDFKIFLRPCNPKCKQNHTLVQSWRNHQVWVWNRELRETHTIPPESGYQFGFLNPKRKKNQLSKPNIIMYKPHPRTDTGLCYLLWLSFLPPKTSIYPLLCNFCSLQFHPCTLAWGLVEISSSLTPSAPHHLYFYLCVFIWKKLAIWC